MNETGIKLPKLVATSVVRGAREGDSHGGAYLIDFERQEVHSLIDWKHSGLDSRRRGGLRGIAFFAGEIYVAASDELLVYDQQFRHKRSFRSTYLKHGHEIHQLNNHLYLTSAGLDSILAFDLEKQAFFWALHIAAGEDGPVGTAYDPQGINGPGGANGPPAENLLHLNNVYADERGIFVSGARTRRLLHIGKENRVSTVAEMPEGIHNARPFNDGILFNDTASDRVCYAGRDGTAIVFPLPLYDPAELTHTEAVDKESVRQGFGRGMCAIDDRLVAAGSSPPTVTVYDLGSRSEVTRVNFSRDIRNTIHSLAVWPF